MAERSDANAVAVDARATAWRPIETAPHDRQVLLFREGDMHVGCWVTDPYTGDEAFAIAELGDRGRAIVHPTHWRPLPAAPSASRGHVTT